MLKRLRLHGATHEQALNVLRRWHRRVSALRHLVWRQDRLQVLALERLTGMENSGRRHRRRAREGALLRALPSARQRKRSRGKVFADSGTKESKANAICRQASLMQQAVPRTSTARYLADSGGITFRAHVGVGESLPPLAFAANREDQTGWSSASLSGAGLNISKVLDLCAACPGPGHPSHLGLHDARRHC